MERLLRWSWPPVLLVLLACPGDRGSKDTAITYPDLAFSDTRAGDIAIRDGTSSGKEAAPGQPCTSWADWTCKEGVVNLCEATCAKGGTSMGLSCIKSGSCLCGLSLGSCGTFTVTGTPCDTCKQAVEQKCCEPKPPDAGPKKG